jgi:uroporphyrin-III C-methyltransferase
MTAAVPTRTCGRVTLVGAGPGDPDLLTLKALRRLRAADALVHDALVAEELLALAPSRCLRVSMGKRCGRADSAGQEHINALLAGLALEGLEVVRLKGGDPFVFGRGGEEALYLRARGIPVEVIPGISAVNGAAATAGIPLTHRGLSAGFMVLEGHAAHLERVDWAALVALGGTWVFLMAKATAPEIARRLLAHGADAALPAALIEQGTLPEQRVQVLTLGAAARDELRPLTDGPGLLLIGPTAALREAIASPTSIWELHAGALPGLSQAGAPFRADRRWR